jgi:PKD repeat protein
MFGSQWQSCSIDGDYSLTDENGNVLVQMTAPDSDFGFGTTHTFCVVAPNVMNDAGISQIISPSGINCAASLTPIVELRNYGNDALTSVTINYQTTGGVQQFSWTGNLATGQTENVTLPAIATGGGAVSFTAFTSNPNGQGDDDVSNDESIVNLNVYTSVVTLPFIEDFETNVFASGEWSVENADNDVSWELTTVGGITPGSTAAKMDFFNYSVAAQRDGMISPRISLVGYNSAEMTFDHAYRRFNQNAADSLIIYVSSDCGQTWDRVFQAAEDGTGSFATQTTNTADFTPAIADDWCFAGGIGASCFTVDLTAYAGQEVFVKFESYNAVTIGNNLFIDNINIDGVPNAAPPIPNFTSNTTTICENGTVQFTDLSTANITDWSWSFPGGVPATSTDQNPVVTYPNSGSYDVELTVTNSFGTETILLTNEIDVNILPVVSVTASSLEICEGTSTQLTASGANSYTWDNGLGAGANKTVSPTVSTTYIVTGSNGLGCEVSESITIDVVVSPTVTANANQTTICLGDVVELSAGGATTYSWDNGLGAGAVQSVSPTTTTIYTVTGVNGGNCSNTANVTITVNESPVVSVNTSSLTICEGTTVALAASGADSYTWTPTTGLSAGSGATINATPNATTTYTVEGTNNCGTDTEEVTIFVNPVPSSPVISQNGNDLSVNLQAGETAMWYLNGTFIGNGPVITMTANGLYEVVVTNNTDCSASSSGNYEMDTASLDEFDASSDIIVFPNPTDGMFTVAMNVTGDVKVWLTDAIGRRLTATKTLSGSSSEVVYDISAFESGIYMIVFESKNGVFTRKVTLK